MSLNDESKQKLNKSLEKVLKERRDFEALLVREVLKEKREIGDAKVPKGAGVEPEIEVELVREALKAREDDKGPEAHKEREVLKDLRDQQVHKGQQDPEGP